MINMKIFVIFVQWFMLVNYVHCSVRIYNAITGLTYYEEENYAYNDYDYDADDYPEPDTQNVSLEQYMQMIRASENVKDYPDVDIIKALENKDELKKLFEVNGGNVDVGPSKNNFGTLCKIVYEYGNPQSMYDIGGNKRTILNLGKYKQRVLHGFCVESSPCTLPGGALFSFNSTCKQNRMEVELLAYEEGNIVPYPFSIDCGCSCSKIRD